MEPYHRHHEGQRSQQGTPRTTPAPMPVYQPPPTAQPPVQIPFADPFHNRDPFMPSSQHRRKDSYGGPASTTNGERAWAGQPGAPGHPSYSHPSYHQHPHHNDHERQSQPHEHARRRSIGAGASPSSRYGGPLDPPPPPGYPSSRNMPPPSPSAATASAFGNHFSRAAPPAQPPYAGHRDLPPFGSRPVGGMSIGSLIGGDRPPPTDRSPRAVTTQNSPTMRHAPPMSPKRARSTSMRDDYGRGPRPLSPRSHAYAEREAQDERERWHAARSQGAPPLSGPNGPPSFRPYQSSPTSISGQSPHVNGPNGIGAPPRPNSQPTSSMQERIEAWRAAQPEHRAPGGFREYPPHHSEPQHRHQLLEREAAHFPDHARHAETQPPSYPAYPPPPHRDDRDGYGRSPYIPAEGRLEFDDRRPPDPRNVPAAASSPPSAGHHLFEPRFRHYGGPAPQDRDRHETSSQLGGRQEDDGHPIPRAFLTVSPDLSRKGGRSSPLPQAVQGAQPRLTGPGGMPSIQSEFGRMFSGLGSGVGGTGTPSASASGYPPPSAIPPHVRSGNPETDEDMVENGEHGHVVDGTSVLHPDMADGSRDDADSLNGRGTPTGQHRSNKRAKTAHASHHHHHHPHAHHHHHHHHTPEDGVAARAGFNTLRFPQTAAPTPPGAIPAGHHHHHHQHAHAHVHPTHHHHRPKPAPHVPSPEIYVKSEELFDLASQKPRIHLGSALYSPVLSLPSNRPRPLEEMQRFMSSSPGSIPCFSDRENGTFTIRVPRAYLAGTHSESGPVAGGLEEICDRRALWGTEVYTDDSDVVAAAVHSGWIKGDFGAYNEDLKDFGSPADTNGTGSVNGTKAVDDAIDEMPTTLETKPARPVAIPGDRDMHVTIVILPPLTKYEGSVMHHLKSRSWRGDHDGMSYVIRRIDFVDEGRGTRFLERGMAARKAKVREEMRRREAADSLLGLGRTAAVGIVGA